MAVVLRVELIVCLTPGRSGNIRGCATRSVNVFDRYVAARCDAEYGSGAGAQQKNDGNENHRIAPESPAQLHKITLPVCFQSNI